MSFAFEETEQIKVGYQAIESIVSMPCPEGPRILVATRDRKVSVVALSNPEGLPESRVVEGYEDSRSKRFTDVTYTTSGDKIIGVSGSHQVYIWDRNTKECTKFSAHTMPITAVALNKDNNKIVTASQDYSIIVSNIYGEKMHTFDSSMEHAHKSWINDIGFFSTKDDEELLVTAGECGCVKIWDLTSFTLLMTFFDGALVDYEKAKEEKTKVKDCDSNFAIKAMAFSKDGSILAYGGKNNVVYLLNLKGREFLTSFKTEDNIYSLAFAENQPLIAYSTPGRIHLYDIISGCEAGSFKFGDERKDYCRSLVFIGGDLFAATKNGVVSRISYSRIN